ncbi:hypothetical protein [Flavobacterium sp.]|jgi:hypothetical protein|uniref:hypothetical protein n=1 Tax=Flavobacterium sp. TaxID=239 RepID=UPI0037C0BA76
MKKILTSFLFFKFIILYAQNNNSTYTLKSYDTIRTKTTYRVETNGDSLKMFGNLIKGNLKAEFNETIIFSEINQLYISKEYRYQIKQIEGDKSKSYELGYISKLVDNKQLWIQNIGVKKSKDSVITNFPTTTYESFLYIIPKINFSKKGLISKYNIVKPSTFRANDENAELLYVADVIIKNKEITTKLKKIILKGKVENFDSIISSYWINDENEIIIASFGNELDKTFFRDLNIDEYAAFKEIFEEIESGVMSIEPK